MNRSPKNAVSVIVCTKRAECIGNLFDNYFRQKYRYKELIVILNRDGLNPAEYARFAAGSADVRIYSRPERQTLGSCLNDGVRLARHPYIAKFDDDDYYAPDYLTESMRDLLRTGADIVGKRAHFMQLANRNSLLFRYYAQANKYVPLVQGATLLMRSRVCRTVAFPDRNRGECVKFCSDCLSRGYRIYAGSPYHFLAVRNRNSKNHTWIVADRKLLSRNVKLLKVRDVKKFIRGPSNRN
mgnify:CR=1 FL=1